ncbi:MAG: hypothetical protein R3C10_00135 [Pirellulales bacterium]
MSITAYSPQRYTDTNYADPNGADVAAFTGAEFSRKEEPGYSGYYGIYYFSHGAGNPNLTFTAAAATATLEWARYSGGSNFGDSSDEYWALDNVLVTGATSLPGDGNGDGWVDGLDYLLWAGAFGAHPGSDGDVSDGDFNDDGWVDGLDYLLWAGNFGSHVSSNVPEPASVFILASGICSWGARPRRRRST